MSSEGGSSMSSLKDGTAASASAASSRSGSGTQQQSHSHSHQHRQPHSHTHVHSPNHQDKPGLVDNTHTGADPHDRNGYRYDGMKEHVVGSSQLHTNLVSVTRSSEAESDSVLHARDPSIATTATASQPSSSPTSAGNSASSSPHINNSTLSTFMPRAHSHPPPHPHSHSHPHHASSNKSLVEQSKGGLVAGTTVAAVEASLQQSSSQSSTNSSGGSHSASSALSAASLPGPVPSSTQLSHPPGLVHGYLPHSPHSSVNLPHMPIPVPRSMSAVSSSAFASPSEGSMSGSPNDAPQIAPFSPRQEDQTHQHQHQHHGHLQQLHQQQQQHKNLPSVSEQPGLGQHGSESRHAYASPLPPTHPIPSSISLHPSSHLSPPSPALSTPSSVDGNRRGQSGSQSFAQVLVAGLPTTMSQSDLHSVFSSLPCYDRCGIVQDPTSGESIGRGWLVFTSQDAAVQAITKLTGMQIGGETLQLTLLPPSGESTKSNLYVCGLPRSYTQQQLEQLFSPYGSIIESKILTDLNGSSRGVAFVRYDNSNSAAHAITAVNGQVLTDGTSAYTLRVKFARDHHRNASAAAVDPSTGMLSPIPSTPNQTHTPRVPAIYESYIPPHVKARGDDLSAGIALFVFHIPAEMRSKDLQELFSTCATVLSARIAIHPQTLESRGFAFVTVATLEDAHQAVTLLNGRRVGRKFIKVSFKKQPTGTNTPSTPITHVQHQAQHQHQHQQQHHRVASLESSVSVSTLAAALSSFQQAAAINYASQGNVNGAWPTQAAAPATSTPLMQSYNQLPLHLLMQQLQLNTPFAPAPYAMSPNSPAHAQVAAATSAASAPPSQSVGAPLFTFAQSGALSGGVGASGNMNGGGVNVNVNAAANVAAGGGMLPTAAATGNNAWMPPSPINASSQLYSTQQQPNPNYYTTGAAPHGQTFM